MVRKTSNNGIRGYINENPQFLNSSNTITFAQDTFVTYYQKEKYFTGNKIKILKPIKDKFKLNERIAPFIISSINKSLDSISWGTGSTVDSIKDFKLLLPIRNNGIDFDFMESFIAELEAQRIAELEAQRIAELHAYLEVTELSSYKLTQEEQQAIQNFDNVKWKEIPLNQLFNNAVRGKRLKSADRIKGSIPFVTAGENKQGISDYVGNDITIFPKNTITIDMFGSAKYRDYDYGADDHVSIIVSNHLNKLSNLFITSSIHKSSHNGQFNYGKNFYPKDADTLIIKLPINKNHEIDFNYMETLISAIQKLVIKDVVDYTDKRIETTKQVTK